MTKTTNAPSKIVDNDTFISTYQETAQARQDMYAFLSRVYLKEQTQETLTALKDIAFTTGEGNDLYKQGCEELDAYLAKLPFRARQDLAVDYARVFVAAGQPAPTAAFPYESVYTSPDGLVMQDACDQVKKIFAAKSLTVNESVEPPDHIAFELEFMARLISEGIAAAQNNDEQTLRESINEQKTFLTKHLLNWVPRFASDIQKYAQTSFYQAIANVTEGFLKMDSEELHTLSS